MKRRAVGIWLLSGVLMIIVQTILGGITRLTGSGLSITEWQPVLGSLPPLNEAQWNKAFDGYKQIAQYKYLNYSFTLSDFKFIYFWEWMHREWARLLFLVFMIGFVFFLVKKYFDKGMIRPLVILVCLGALQGLIGWVMVKSGLNDTNLYVDHFKLAIHFISAMVLACFTMWFALQLIIPKEQMITESKFYRLTIAIISVLTVQLVYGAFMAGLKAASAASTWPGINGAWIPGSFWSNSVLSNPISVHFIHRNLAFLVLILTLMWYFKTMQLQKQKQILLLSKTRYLSLGLVILQVTLGIFTVINARSISAGKFGIFEIFAASHQIIAMFLLMSFIVNLYIVHAKNR